jgi:hypothetical protein
VESVVSGNGAGGGAACAANASPDIKVAVSPADRQLRKTTDNDMEASLRRAENAPVMQNNNVA